MVALHMPCHFIGDFGLPGHRLEKATTVEGSGPPGTTTGYSGRLPVVERLRQSLRRHDHGGRRRGKRRREGW